MASGLPTTEKRRALPRVRSTFTPVADRAEHDTACARAKAELLPAQERTAAQGDLLTITERDPERATVVM